MNDKNDYRNRFFVLFFCGLLFLNYGFATNINAEIPPMMSHLDKEDGLIQNSVRTIFQDSKGFMWFGTENGLSRYDGYEFENFTHNVDDDNTLSSGTIYDIVEDKSGNLWIATKNGLNKFDPVTRRFTRFKKNEAKQSISDNNILCLLVVDNRLWIGTEKGLDLLDLSTEGISNIKDTHVFGKSISALASDNKGGVWIGLYDYELIYFSTQENKWHAYSLQIEDHEVFNYISKIIPENNYLWLGTDKGLVNFNPYNNKHEIIKFVPDQSVSITGIAKLGSDIWLSIYDHGIFKYNYKTKKIDTFAENINDKYSLSGNEILSLYRGSDNFLWVSIFGKGVDYFKKDENLIVYRNIPEEKNSLNGKNVFGILEDEKNHLWFATDNGVSVYNSDKNQYESFSMGKTFSLSQYMNGPIWIGGVNGLYFIDNKENKITNEEGLTHFTSVLHYNDNSIIVGAKFRGVWHYDLSQNQFKQYKHIDENYSNLSVIYVMRGWGGELLIASRQGLHLLDMDKKIISRYEISDNAINSYEINYLAKDDNALWLATTNYGLIKVQDNNIIARLTIADGLPDNTVRGLAVVDKSIWLSTDHGLAKVYKKDNTYVVKQFSGKIFKSEYNNKAVYIKKNKKILFGGVFGVAEFDGEKLNDFSNVQVSITDFRYAVPSNKAVKDFISLDVDKIKTVSLDYNENVINMDFSTFMKNSRGILYSYRLLGSSNESWIILNDKRHSVLFNDLQPGKYTFMVRTGLSATQWSEKITSIDIEVKPPWWMTIEAYILYVLSIILLMYQYIKVREKKFKRNQEILEKAVKERTRELSQRTHELSQSTHELTEHKHELTEEKKKVEKLLNEKNERIANISHELKTPITLILGPIVDMLNENNDVKNKEKLELIYRSAENLSVRINEILLLSRMSYIAEQEKEPQCVSEIANFLCLSFKKLIKLSDINFLVKVEPDLWVFALPGSVEILLTNLISNAFKYTEKGFIKFEVKPLENNKVCIFIADSGVGISEAMQHKIFDRFTRGNTGMKKAPEGTGIGLALVKQLVEQHKGEISLESDGQSGCEIAIKLDSYQNTENLKSEEFTMSDDGKIKIKQINRLKEQDSSRQYDIDIISNDDKKIKESILIIDDNVDMCEYLKSILSSSYRCHLAFSGKTGIELAKDLKPKLILCDLMMPEVDGFEVLNSLRNHIETSHIPFLILTANDESENEIKSYQLKVDDYITKPFVPGILKEKIKSIFAMVVERVRFSSHYVNSGNARIDNDKYYTPKDKKFICKFMKVLDKFVDHPEAALRMMADEMSIEPRTLQNRSQNLWQKTPTEMLGEKRIEVAKKLLKEEDLSIEMISSKVGFNSQQSFSTKFKKIVGVSPRKYRKAGGKDIIPANTNEVNI